MVQVFDNSLRKLKQKFGLRANKPLPHFLVIGTQKGGTTSLHKLLSQHPDVFLPECKEVHYFSLHADKPISWYAEQFNSAKPGQHRGEVCPYYLFHPEAPQRIKKVLPKVRLIALLRDPVERTLSQYFHARRHGFEELELEAALAAEPQRLASGDPYSLQKHSYLSRSCYLEQLCRYKALFPSRQIMVLRSEDLFQETQNIWEKIQSFLGIRQCPLPAPLTKANAGKGEATSVNQAIRGRLRRELASTAAGVKKLYGFDWGW